MLSGCLSIASERTVQHKFKKIEEIEKQLRDVEAQASCLTRRDNPQSCTSGVSGFTPSTNLRAEVDKKMAQFYAGRELPSNPYIAPAKRAIMELIHFLKSSPSTSLPELLKSHAEFSILLMADEQMQDASRHIEEALDVWGKLSNDSLWIDLKKQSWGERDNSNEWEVEAFLYFLKSKSEGNETCVYMTKCHRIIQERMQNQTGQLSWRAHAMNLYALSSMNMVFATHHAPADRVMHWETIALLV